MHITLYQLLYELVGMETDVVVINRVDRTIILEHSREQMVADDVPKKFWNLLVETVAVSDKYQNKLCVYVDL